MTRITIGEVIIKSKDSMEDVIKGLEKEYELISVKKIDEDSYQLACKDEYGKFDIEIKNQ